MTHISSGMYRPGDSIMHGLDAVFKLICFILLLAAVLTTDTPAGYTGMALFVMAVAYLGGLDKKTALGTVKRYWWFLLLVLLSNFMFYAPKETFGAWWIFTPSYRGLFKGISVSLRAVLIFVLANVLTCTTAPLKLTEAVESLFSPLAFFKIPVWRFVVMSRLAVRFLPTLFEDAEFVRLVQTARGTEYKSRGLLSKAAAAAPLALPVLLTSFKRAENISLAMEERGFRPGCDPFHVKRPEPSAADWTAILVCAVVCVMQIIIL